MNTLRIPIPSSDQAVLAAWQRELTFTDLHRSLLGQHRLERETACHRWMTLQTAGPVQSGDRFAGRWGTWPKVGLGIEPGGMGYYCRFPDLVRAIQEAADSGVKARLQAMFDYWCEHATIERLRGRMTQEQRFAMPDNGYGGDGVSLAGLPDDFVTRFITTHKAPLPAPQVSIPMYRLAGTVLDYERVMPLGLPGLRRQVETRLGADREPVRRLAAAVLATLDTVDALAAHWAASARQTGEETVARVLENLRVLPPSTFRECLQLHWLLLHASGSLNHGRMDRWAGPFLQRDLDAGLIDREQAVDLLQGSFRLMLALRNTWNNRIIVWGEGRGDDRVCATFTEVAIEATRRHHDKAPSLTIRLDDAFPPALLHQALDCLAENNTFPILLNDRVNVDAYAKAAGITRTEAQDYFPLGCGEYTLVHHSLNSPNGGINLASALGATLDHGRDPASGRVIGLDLGGLDTYRTWDELWAAYRRQVEFHVQRLAEVQKLIYDVTGEELAYPLTSALYDGCLDTGLGLVQGGISHLGGTVESYGDITTADSLYAIREALFEQRFCDGPILLSALKNDWQGHEDLRRRLHALPKFGNDHDGADAMASAVHDHVCLTTRAQAARVGMNSFLIVVINNGFGVVLGRGTSSTADGRGRGQPLSNGNAPTSGNDRNGLTAVLNSMAKLRADHHAGAVHNLSVTCRMLKRDRQRFLALLDGYWDQGGTQLMLTPVDPGQLQDAMLHPKNYPNLLVRMGGWSARFVDLSAEFQRDIAARTLHD